MTSKPFCLEGVNGMERILRVCFAHVLWLFGRDERGGRGRLNPHEDGGKTRLDHGLHEFVVLHEIHAGFGTEAEGIVACTLPGDEGPEQAQGLAPVADKVIIHEKQRAAPTQVVQQDRILPAFAPGFWSAALCRTAW